MTDPSDLRGPVDAHPLLGVLPERDRARLGDVAQRVSFQPGQAICREGSAPTHFYLFVEGRARVTRTRPNGSQEQVAELEKPALLGLVGVVDRRRRSTTVAALTPCTCLRFPRSVLVASDGDRGLRLRETLAAAMNEQLRVVNLRLMSLVGDVGRTDQTFRAGWRLPPVPEEVA